MRSCLLSRKELTDLILNSPQTTDGIYFCPRFRVLVLMNGPIADKDYFYDRYLFKDKICFSSEDIKTFLSTTDLGIDTDLIKIMDDKIGTALNGLESIHLKDRVPKTTYTLEELIDTCVFLVKEKYA